MHVFPVPLFISKLICDAQWGLCDRGSLSHREWMGSPNIGGIKRIPSSYWVKNLSPFPDNCFLFPGTFGVSFSVQDLPLPLPLVPPCSCPCLCPISPSPSPSTLPSAISQTVGEGRLKMLFRASPNLSLGVWLSYQDVTLPHFLDWKLSVEWG